jgi:hypothetical protein
MEQGGSGSRRATGVRRRASRIWAALAVAVVLLPVGVALTATPAGAAEASGCHGDASSSDKSGHGIDTANAPGEGGTESAPFQIDPYGKVAYEYEFDSAMHDGTWSVSTTGALSLSFSGKVTSAHEQSGSGTESLKKRLVKKVPILGEVVLFTGLVKVDVDVTAPGGGHCVFSGWVEVKENPARTPLFYAAVVFLVIAALLLFLGWPTADVALLFEGAVPRSWLRRLFRRMGP